MGESAGNSGNANVTGTHWSLVLAAADSQSPINSEALEELCRRYWQPLFIFALRSGNSPPDAQDLTQAFFADFLSRKAISAADPQRGRFRCFLQASFRNFLHGQHARNTSLKRGGGNSFIPIHKFVEEGGAEPAHHLSPEILFDQRWAARQLENALDRVRAEYAEAGRAPLFDLLKTYVWGERNAPFSRKTAGRGVLARVRQGEGTSSSSR